MATGTQGQGQEESPKECELKVVWVRLTYPVVSSLVLIVNPVQVLVSPVLHTVLGHPLINVTTTLSEDPRNHFDFLQIYL